MRDFRFIFAWMAASLAISLIARVDAFSAVRDLTPNEARELALIVVDAQAKRLPGFGIGPDEDPRTPQFYRFIATWDNKNGSVVVGFFSVNRRTGDVWNPVICKRIESDALLRVQTNLRRRLKLTPEELEDGRELSPCEN